MCEFGSLCWYIKLSTESVFASLFFFLATVWLAVLLKRYTGLGSAGTDTGFRVNGLCWTFLVGQVFVVFLCSVYIAFQLGWSTSPEIGIGYRYLSDNSNFVVLSTFPLLGVLLVTVSLKVNNGLTWTKLGMKVPSIGTTKILVYVAILLLCLFGIEALWDAAFSQGGEEISPSGLLLKSLDRVSLILFIIWVVVVTPIVEEVFFRGIILSAVSNMTGPWVGLVLQACLFSLMHYDFEYFFVYFAAGIALGWVYRKSGSLYPGIVIHALHSTGVTANLYHG